MQEKKKKKTETIPRDEDRTWKQHRDYFAFFTRGRKMETLVGIERGWKRRDGIIVTENGWRSAMESFLKGKWKVYKRWTTRLRMQLPLQRLLDLTLAMERCDRRYVSPHDFCEALYTLLCSKCGKNFIRFDFKIWCNYKKKLKCKKWRKNLL